MWVFKALVMVVGASFEFCLSLSIIMSGSASRCYRCFSHNLVLERVTIQWAASLLPAVTLKRGEAGVCSVISQHFIVSGDASN